MRILYHHRTRSQDGQRVHIDGLVGALRRAGHEVEIVGPRPHRDAPADPKPMAPSPAADHGAPPANKDAPPANKSAPPRGSLVRELAELAYNVPETMQLSAAARRCRPEAVYSRHALYTSSAVRLARRLSLPLLIEVNAPLAQEREEHGGLFLRRHARALETRVLNGADRVIVVTEVMGEILVRQGVRRELLEVHWNGLEPDALVRTRDSAALRRKLGLEDRVVLGFVGFVRDWNRLDRTFPFLARLPSAVLLLVGDGPDRPRLEEAARRLGVADQLRFLGTVARAQVLDHVACFDVALLPEVTEYASPLKLLDYFACSRAVLAPDRRNLREVLTDGENGFLFDPADDAAFEKKLSLLVASPELRERLGAAGRATIDRRGLTWDHNAGRVVARFEEARASRLRGVATQGATR